MTDRAFQTMPKDQPYHAHPMREMLSLDHVMPSYAALLDRMFDRIENEAAS